MMQPISVMASGMVTGVGLTSATACAAIRCGITNFTETRFRDQGGEWLIGSAVPLEEPFRGRTKLIRLLIPALRECLTELRGVPLARIPLLLGVAEEGRPGRLEHLDASLLRDVQAELRVRFHESSQVLPRGRIAGVLALQQAGRLIQEGRVPGVLIAGVDTLLVSATLAAFEQKGRLLTSKNSDGFIPGEAGAAVLVAPPGKTAGSDVSCRGIGFAQENAPVGSDEPLRADGLVAAIRAALADARQSMADVDYRLSDVSGEQYGFKEASLALGRLLRTRKPTFELWHPSDCIGEVGAAIVPCVLAVARTAARKGYAPGSNVLCQFGNDGGERAAAVVGYGGKDGA